jgi:hypothetical protein
LPKNAQKRTIKKKEKKKKVRTYFFWRAGADVRRFLVLFFLSPLGTEHREQEQGRGAAQKKIDGPPRTLTKSPTHPPTIRLSPKNTIKMFLQKVHVENFSQNFDKNFDDSFSSTFFVLSRFWVFLSDGSSKTLQKTFCKKNHAEKKLQKIRPKIQNRLFLEKIFITFLGVSR